MRGNLRLALIFAASLGVFGYAQQSDGGTYGPATTDIDSTAKTSTARTSPVPSSTAIHANATCFSRTANYITHTLPQQCLRTDRTKKNTTRTGGSSEPTSDLVPGTGYASGWSASTVSVPSIDLSDVSSTSLVSVQSSSAAAEVQTVGSANSESESPLDNAKFLSFEEWKKQNNPKSLDPGPHPREGPDRPRPGIQNALDGFGEDGEIELDFSGFGSPASGPRQQQAAYRASGDAPVSQATPTAHSPRSKDAGQTCKERTNYASFDCAATVLKNNPECKSSSSVLVENKDSYMLNTCSAQNKFFIVELCNDILVDTVVLANYEFFSSIFRHFRVSVSDVYPVKLDKWKDLGTFEARNTREVQAFLIEHPQIWARYLRVEFLTHYGSEYYCPVSLLRVHGTTMLEDMRHQESMAQGEATQEAIPEDEASSVIAEPQEPEASTDESSKETFQAMPDVNKKSLTTSQTTDEELPTKSPTFTDRPTSQGPDLTVGSDVPSVKVTPCNTYNDSSTTTASTGKSSNTSDVDFQMSSSAKREPLIMSHEPSIGIARTDKEAQPTGSGLSSTNATASKQKIDAGSTAPGQNNTVTVQNATSVAKSNSAHPSTTDDSRDFASSISSTATNATSMSSSSSVIARTSPSTASAPPLPQPSTQESFFKSIHKRLQQLEANSTLSLQYIEEQSRILRDAFSKVEKRQVSATTSFLTNLNSTVMQELHGFRQAYDQLWQSTVIELEGQREQYQREMLAMSSRLTFVVDELVWQKRMGIVQSTLLLLCLGLVIFARSGSTGYLEVPLMQQMMNKSSAALGRAGWESPPISPSPENRSPVSQFRRRLWRSVTDPSGGDNATDGTVSVTDSRPGTKDGPLGSSSVDVNVEPPTPPSGVSTDGSGGWEEGDEEEDVLDPRQSQSGPATPRGTRESESGGEGFLDAG